MSDLIITPSNSGSIAYVQNDATVTGTVTIPASKNAMLAGPISIHTLTVAGNLNVVDSLTVSTGDLTITGHLRIS